jgi:ArsR family transcriptional regulator, arsenate/arsenite/antimonite-responsive transcriptional repressor
MKRDYVNIFKALGDPNRLRIMKMIAEKELCLCEIREILDLSSSTVSQHLTILRDAGLLLDAKDGKWVNFRVNDKSNLKHIRAILALIRESFDDDDMVRDDRKKVRTVNRRTICSM